VSRPPVVNRNVPAHAATRPIPPIASGSVPVRKRPVRFHPGFFEGATCDLALVHPHTGLVIDEGTFYLEWVLGAFGHSLQMLVTRSTYEAIVSNEDLIFQVKAAIHTGLPMGVKSKLIDVRDTPAWGREVPPIVDRSAGEPATLNLVSFSHRVAGLVTDILGFDMTQMSDEVRGDFVERYSKIRDEAREYREAMARVDGALEILQGKIREMFE
jgi:hypothetical protein